MTSPQTISFLRRGNQCKNSMPSKSGSRGSYLHCVGGHKCPSQITKGSRRKEASPCSREMARAAPGGPCFWAGLLHGHVSKLLMAGLGGLGEGVGSRWF